MMKVTKFLIGPAVLGLSIAACNSERGLDPADAVLAKGGCNKNNPCETPPIAANPKYHNSTYSVANNGFQLLHSFKQTGLGNFSVEYLFEADFEAIYDCKNKGGNIMPESSPFHADLSVEEFVTIDPENGSVNTTRALTASPFENDTFGCPGDHPASKNFRWQLRPETVRWTNIRFCWGQSAESLSELQGPVPGAPGAAATINTTSGTVAGTPLDGDRGLRDGIFSEQCLKS
jgi:hypothetical protein